jgi:3-oxoacyl-[acyl-carrier protein] reductase
MIMKDCVALVTGSATGIGESIARLFASQGARVFLIDCDSARNDATAHSIRSEFGFAHAATVDVCDPLAVAAAVDSAISQFGRIDVLVNNAGIFPRRKFIDMTETEWDRMQAVNLKSMFHCIKAVAPGMISRGSGKIVNISSVTFHLGTPELSHYVASKAGVIGLTRSLAREFGEYNVHVNCITPGAVFTESEKNFVTQEAIQQMVGMQSLKRRILPLDIARTALFLASSLSDGITGQTLNVDGGWVMH